MIAGLRGVRVGRKVAARQERRGYALAVLEAGGHEAAELACDGAVDAVLDGALRGGFGGSAEGWLTLLRCVSQPTPCHTPGLARGSPLRSPTTRSLTLVFRWPQPAPSAHKPGAGCPWHTPIYRRVMGGGGGRAGHRSNRYIRTVSMPRESACTPKTDRVPM